MQSNGCKNLPSIPPASLSHNTLDVTLAWGIGICTRLFPRTARYYWRITTVRTDLKLFLYLFGYGTFIYLCHRAFHSIKRLVRSSSSALAGVTI